MKDKPGAIIVRISIVKWILLFAVITIFGFVAVVGTGRWALEQLRVGGPLYTKIKLGNDLIADILPPPEYVIEAYLESTLAMRDPSSHAGRRARLAELHKDYEDRRDYWRKSELDAGLKQKLIERSDAEVQRFWKASERDMIDALARGDRKEAEKAYAELSTAYAAHRAIIDEIVKQANDANTALESDASSRVDWFNTLLWSISGLVCATVVLGLLGIIFGIIRPLSAMTGAMRNLADGDLTTGIPSLNRRDEIGSMAAAVEVFRDNSVRAAESDRRMEELRAGAEQEQRQVLIDMCRILEADLDSAVAEVLAISNDASQRGEAAARDAQTIASEACAVAASSEQATSNVTSVSAATEQLSAAGREIAQRAVETAQFANRAAEEVEQASTTVAALNEAATRIETVTHLISEVAAQTNLLALNATIEAARAGEAGRGFAVVAHEVKALSKKTSEAAEDIAHRIQDICRVSRESIDVIGKVGVAVSGIKEVTGAVAAAAEQQEATLLDVARSLTEASQGVALVSENVTRISGRSAEIETQSRLVSQLVTGTNGRVAELRANMVVSLRSSDAGDRRSQENRRPVSVPARMRCGASRIEGTILDLSEGGLRFRSTGSAAAACEGQPVVFETEQFGEVAGTIISIGQSSIHVQFDELSEDRNAAIARFLRSVDEADRSFVAAAREAAQKIGAAFEAEIARGTIPEARLFDFDYRPIAGSNPQQFDAPFTELCDRLLPAIQEPALALDPRVVFCAAVDRNAYLPTHNRQFSQTPRRDDPVWNAANCRNRRFFKDSAGLRAARTSREFALQTYDRDMGGGNVVTLKEIDVPIHIKGKHWGGLRLAFKA
ncbi:methyl-accepting chemotaxis protein [Bradyrhizobium sp.]|uniref:methyl-accepting chemotaxis protein n=1 Tax=Bradyrhizobium sp. TaxID=376 RepID=UPI001D2DFF90|nr:methyl-accepting chemotaxis protein [Bradyrhizobium sp.]MBI5321726.1 PilZ domain-containing protein [Bradyrhizobium sp.]